MLGQTAWTFAWRGIFWQLVSRTIRTAYLENLSGIAWLLLQPLLLLAVYSFVFTRIFDARYDGSESIGFVPFLAVAFWPWTAFSESILRAAGSVTENAALIAKVAFPVELLPLSAVTATFAMNMTGYLAVLAVLQISGVDLHWAWLSAAAWVLLWFYLFACAIALITSALSVFLRDVAQILPPLMTLWFFTTPILYSSSYLPDQLQELFSWNPATWFIDKIRHALLHGSYSADWSDLLVPVSIVLFLALAFAFFARFRGHFEDFL